MPRAEDEATRRRKELMDELAELDKKNRDKKR
jgi:hypothetical protein